MTTAVVSKVDHIFVPVADPTPLYELFTSTLGLPVSSPVHDYGPFRSAGVCVGNCNIELVAGDPKTMPYFVPTEPLTVRGIGFEPAADPIAGALDALDARKIRHTDPFPFEAGGHRSRGHLWTNVFLSGLVGRAAVAFLCEWHSDESVRGKAASDALKASGGGALGVRRLAEITIGLAGFENAAPRWRNFLAPAEPDDHGAFRLGDGPAIRVRPSPMDAVAGLWLEVESLAAARRALHALDLCGPTRASGIGLDYARTGGLDVWLTERR